MRLAAYSAAMVFALVLLLAAAPDAGAVPSVHIEGGPLRAESFTMEKLKALGPATVDWKDKIGAHRMTGVPVEKLLRHLGLAEQPRHAELRAALVATAADGFVAVFSIAELLGEFGPSTVILAWEQNGKPLPPQHGAFRLVVPTDKRGARSIYQLTSLKLVPL